MVPIPAGALLTVSTGEYSDYSVDGVFRALKEIDAEALREEWLAAHPEQNDCYSFKECDFLAWIGSRGMLEPLDTFEWHLSDYARASEMWVRKSD